MKKRIYYAFYLLITVGSILAAAEFLSTQIVKAKIAKTHPKTMIVDPHLVWASNSDFNEFSKSLVERGHTLDHGFTIYKSNSSSDNSSNKLKILILGGSTSDSINFDEFRKSLPNWPEYLAEIINKNGKSAIVINGAIGGFNSSQELFKLLRDGLEYSPNIIITYGGLRELESMGALPYPMVLEHQRQIVKIIRNTMQQGSGFPASLMKNTITLLKTKNGLISSVDYGDTLGLPSKNDHAEAWLRNIRAMRGIANEFGSGFCAIMQPLSPSSKAISEHLEEMHTLRNRQKILTAKLPFVTDWTNLFTENGNNSDNLQTDGEHNTDLGNKVIADNVYKLIFDEKKCNKDNNLAGRP